MKHSGIRVFVDSDVIISSLISPTGAAFRLLNEIETAEFYLSNFSVAELERVARRLNIELEKLSNLITTRLKLVHISQSYEVVQARFIHYVADMHDAHIVAGAKQARANFLVSYNIRHFQAERLKQDFQLILMTPGMFLQYLRSL